MKHILLAVLILALVLVFCLGSVELLERSTQNAIALLFSAEEAALKADLLTAQAFAEQAQADWHASEGLFGILLNHSETDEITFLFSDLISGSSADEDFPELCAELAARLEHIAEMEKPYYYNIF